MDIQLFQVMAGVNTAVMNMGYMYFFNYSFVQICAEEWEINPIFLNSLQNRTEDQQLHKTI